jgi:hypothetical protein
VNVAPEIVVVSGGAESVSIAVAEAAWRLGYPYAVVSIVPNSLLRGAAGAVAEFSIWEKNLAPERARERLGECLALLRATAPGPLSVFPTEDDGLRLLNELKPSLDGIATFSRATALRMGGLDKGELMTFLCRAGFGHAIAPTVVLHDLGDFDKAIASLGDDAVFKPAYKPWAAVVGRSGMKVVTRRNAQSLDELRRALEHAWPLGASWVAQRRLKPLDGGERSACIVRGDRVDGCEVVERLKYPQAGGSAVWVESTRSRELMPLAASIADALKIVGVCEMSFLADDEERPRLLELNTRPWLQIDLIEKSGYPIVGATLDALRGMPVRGDGTAIQERGWIHLERLAMSLASGDCGSRLATAHRLFSAFSAKTSFAVYSTRLPGMRRRWLGRSVRKLFGG